MSYVRSSGLFLQLQVPEPKNISLSTTVGAQKLPKNWIGEHPMLQINVRRRCGLEEL